MTRHCIVHIIYLCSNFVFNFFEKTSMENVRDVCETANTGYTKAEHWPPTRVQNLCVLPLSKHSLQLLSRTVLLTHFLLLTGRRLAARTPLTVTTAALRSDPHFLFVSMNFNSILISRFLYIFFSPLRSFFLRKHQVC